ncbi:hypothetical protein FQR65_LT03141 [Abscondita terminalis]|nr:hypothetical protein FQR65_LT03141 [Abscondita terminalis]
MDKNIDESIRKPRRSKGTPFFKQRNYYALGILGLSALTGILYEFWGQTAILKQSIKDGKFDYSDQLKERIARQKLSVDPTLESVLQKLDEKRLANEQTKPEPEFVKILKKFPEL